MKPLALLALLRKIGLFLRFFWRRWNDVQVWQVAGSLTFTTLLALVPLLTIMLVLMSAFPILGDIERDFMDFVQSVIVPSGASVVADYLAQFKQHAKSLTTMGILMMLVTSLLLIQTIDQTFNRIWRVKKRRVVWLQFPVYWALLTFVPVIFGLGMSIVGGGGFSAGLKSLTSILLSILVFYILYGIVPNRFVPHRHALIGAILTTILLKCLKFGFDIYIRDFNSYQLIYGAFSAIPVFLLWLHLLWGLILTGAVWTACLSYWSGDAFLRESTQKMIFDDIVQILLLLLNAQREGQSLVIQDFRSYVLMGYDELGDLLERLEARGYIASVKNGWILKKSPENIRLLDLVNEFVYTAPEQKSPVNQALSDILLPCHHVLEVNLLVFERDYLNKK